MLKAAWLALLFASPVRAGLTPEGEAHRKKALEHLYNLDYAQTRLDVREIIQTSSNNAFAYMFEAASIWWQATTEFGLFKDTPTLEGLFENDVRTAITLAKTRFDSSPQEAADSYFVAGMALGLRGQWYLVKRHWIKAYFDGKKAIKYLKKCVKTNPEYYDAYLGLGMFDYQAARLPGMLKLPALMMVRGNAERGKERLELAAAKGHLVSEQTALYLLTIYMQDQHNYARALPLIRSLRQTYPDSPYFQFLELISLYKTQDWESSHRQALALFSRAKEDPAILGRKQLSILCGFAGAHCLDKENLEEATAWLSHAIDVSPSEPNSWKTLCHLYRALAYDMLGRRQEAVADYDRALAQPDVAGAHERAQRCLKLACGREEVERMLKELSREDETPPEKVIQTQTKDQAPEGEDDLLH